MPKALISLVAGASLMIAGGVAAASEGRMSRDAYKAEKDKIEAQYNADADRCKTLSGNAKDICNKEAKGKENVARADLEASHRNTDKARYDARAARADADYDVAK